MGTSASYDAMAARAAVDGGGMHSGRCRMAGMETGVRPLLRDAVQYGYVETVELRGDLFKTYEGVLLPYKNLHDTTRIYREDFTFSTSDKLGKTMREFQNSGRPLRVEYRTYRHAFPWRGEQKRVVVRVDTVNPDSIIPADWLRPH